MTPFLYQRDILERVLQAREFTINSLYHWTNFNSLKLILEDKCLYSQGTLWGLKGSVSSRPRTTNADAAHGFIDYVFLGTTNWFAKGKPSHYGDCGIEIDYQILLHKEFFVFPFNTGIHWNEFSLR